MANKHKKIDADELELLAAQFILECSNNKIEQLSNKGEIVEVAKRRIAAWKFFCSNWLPNKGFDFYTVEYSYEVDKDVNHPLSYTLKKVKAKIDGYSEDVVANEGTGIFWAKNRLGMHDRQQLETKNVDKFDFDA